MHARAGTRLPRTPPAASVCVPPFRSGSVVQLSCRPCVPRRSRCRSRGSVSIDSWNCSSAAVGAASGRSSSQPHVRRIRVHRARIPLALDRRERVDACGAYSALPRLANCGNSSAGSTSLVGWKTPASSSGLSLAGPPNAAVKPSSGSATPVTPAGSALSVRVNATEVVLAEVVRHDQAVLEEAAVGCWAD